MSFQSADPVLFIGKSHVTASLGANHPEVGTTMRDGDENYIWVYNVGSSTASVSYGCVVSAVSGYSVTVSSTTGTDFLVGVVKHVDIPTGSYGWLCTRGWTQVEMGASDSCAAGLPLALGVDGTFALKSNATTTNQTPVIGKSMEAIASAGSGSAFISVF
jgi:hypothetical protein